MLSLITRTLLLRVQPSPMAQPSSRHDRKFSWVVQLLRLMFGRTQHHSPLSWETSSFFFFFISPKKKNRSHARLKVTKYVKYEMIHPSLDFVHYVPMWERSNATSLTTFNHTFIPKSYIFVPDDHRLF